MDIDTWLWIWWRKLWGGGRHGMSGGCDGDHGGLWHGMDIHAYGKHTWAKEVRVAHMSTHMHRSKLVKNKGHSICK